MEALKVRSLWCSLFTCSGKRPLLHGDLCSPRAAHGAGAGRRLHAARRGVFVKPAARLFSLTFLLSWAFVFTIALTLSYTFCLCCQINTGMTAGLWQWRSIILGRGDGREGENVERVTGEGEGERDLSMSSPCHGLSGWGGGTACILALIKQHLHFQLLCKSL